MRRSHTGNRWQDGLGLFGLGTGYVITFKLPV